MTNDDRDLLERFIATFEVLDHLDLSEHEIAEKQCDGDISPLMRRSSQPGDWPEWRPIRMDVPKSELREFYWFIPGPLPRLYEAMILSYCWFEVDLGRLRLLPSLPPGLTMLVRQIRREPQFFETLAPLGLVQFGKGADVDYDPVCFDLNIRDASGDCRVVRLDHEELLRGRVSESGVLAESFRQLVEAVIADASAKTK